MAPLFSQSLTRNLLCIKGRCLRWTQYYFAFARNTPERKLGPKIYANDQKTALKTKMLIIWVCLFLIRFLIVDLRKKKKRKRIHASWLQHQSLTDLAGQHGESLLSHVPRDLPGQDGESLLSHVPRVQLLLTSPCRLRPDCLHTYVTSSVSVSLSASVVVTLIIPTLSSCWGNPSIQSRRQSGNPKRDSSGLMHLCLHYSRLHICTCHCVCNGH